jgi:hypothetical protein
MGGNHAYEEIETRINTPELHLAGEDVSCTWKLENLE